LVLAQSSARKEISLVLGSGGARGIAHIGVIRCLEERGYRIRYIAGCSIGALVGGIYAAGKLETYADWVCALERGDVLRLLDFSFRRAAVFAGDRIIGEMKALIGDARIEDLAIGFTAVATDLNGKREIWLNRGSLWDAVRASIAVPLVFPPVQSNGELLVDGGLINPVPIGPTLNDPAAWTFAVDLNSRAEPGVELCDRDDAAPEKHTGALAQLKLRIRDYVDDLVAGGGSSGDDRVNAFELGMRSMEVMQTTIGRMKLAGYTPRLIVPIPRNLCTFFEFYRARDLIEFGYRRTGETLDAERL
jgi:NTE family protein